MSTCAQSEQPLCFVCVACACVVTSSSLTLTEASQNCQFTPLIEWCDLEGGPTDGGGGSN